MSRPEPTDPRFNITIPEELHAAIRDFAECTRANTEQLKLLPQILEAVNELVVIAQAMDDRLAAIEVNVDR